MSKDEVIKRIERKGFSLAKASSLIKEK